MSKLLALRAFVALALFGLALASCTTANGGEAAGEAGGGDMSAGDCGDGGGGSGVTADGTAYVDELASADAEFAFSLFEQLSTREGNLFFSPHSILTALSMTYVGARGRTETQMADALEMPALGTEGDEMFTPEYRERLAAGFGALSDGLTSDASDETHVFAEANALWHQEDYSFLERFLALNRDGFGAGVEALDFHEDWEGARATINDWVEEKTLGKIEELIRPGDLDNLVRIVLTNAVYFKGLWATQFDPADTREAPFHVRPGDPSADVVAPMMSRSGEYAFARIEDPGLALLELPYRGGDASMLVLLPDEEMAGGLSALEGKLTPALLESWTSRMGEREVLVAIPRFEMTWGTENIIPDLEALGILDLFNDAADLSGMDGSHELYVSKVLHKAFVEVNEEGTEAAAATAVVGRLKASRPLMFRADRPFLFLIRDTGTGAVLFMGRVADPTA